MGVRIYFPITLNLDYFFLFVSPWEIFKKKQQIQVLEQRKDNTKLMQQQPEMSSEGDT